MIPIQELLYLIDLKLNKVSSGVGQHIPPEDKILILNESQIRVLKKKINVNNIYQMGFDAFKSRYEDLQNLVVPQEVVKVKKTDEVYDSYEADLSELSGDYFLPVEIIALCSKGGCTKRLVNIPRVVKHVDLSLLIDNDDFKPSFEFQETIAVISSNKLLVYTDGTFTVDELRISYLRFPQKMDVEGYIHLTGDRPSSNKDCELPTHLQDELVSMAVAELAYITGNNNIAQSQQAMSQYSE